MLKLIKPYFMKTKSSLLLLIFYRVSIDVCYIYAISPQFSYLGSKLDISLFKLVLSYFFMIVLYWTIPQNSARASNVIIQYFYIMMMVPLFSNLGLANQSIDFVIICTIGFIITIYSSLYLPGFKANRRLKSSGWLLNYIMPLFLALILVFMANKYGIHMNALDLSSTYSIRHEQKITGVLKYLFMWAYKIIAPFIIVHGVAAQNKFLIFVGVCFEVLLFFVTPHKEMILLVGLVIFVYYIMKSNINFLRSMMTILLILCIFSTVLFLLTGNYLPASLTSRMLTGPATTKFQYYDFFKDRNKLFYAGATLGNIFGIEYPFSLPLGYYISDQFTGMYSNANVGYLGSAYANWGAVGVLLQSFFLGIILRYLDSFSKQDGCPYICALMVYPLSQLNDNDLLTILVTGGVFLMLILLNVKNSEIKETY